MQSSILLMTHGCRRQKNIQLYRAMILNFKYPPKRVKEKLFIIHIFECTPGKFYKNRF